MDNKNKHNDNLNNLQEDKQTTVEIERQEDTQQADTTNATSQEQSNTDKTSTADKKTKLDEQLDAFANSNVAVPKKKKFSWVGMLFLFIIIGVGIWLMVQQASTIGAGEIQSIDSILANLDWKYVAITLAIFVAVIILDSMKYGIVTKTVKNKANTITSTKVSLIGRYYDNITPFASGGQPMQIYYLHKKGYTGGEASAVILIKYFANMFAWLAICFWLMILNRGALDQYVQDGATKQLFLVAGWIGWAVNALVPVMIVLFVVFPKLTQKMVGFFVSLGCKMRFVKDKERAMKRAERGVTEFRTGFAIMSKKPFNFLLLMFVCVLEPFLSMTLPYFVLMSMSNGAVEASAATMFGIMTLNVFATLSVAVIPTPGNSGFVENSVLLAFSNVAQTVAFWVVFVWRLLTYYIYILVGVIINIIDIIRAAIRAKRQEKNWIKEHKGKNE